MAFVRRRALLRATLAAPLLPLGALAARSLTGCGDGTDPGEFDQVAMLRSLADVVIVPTFVALEAASESLSGALSALAAEPSEAALTSAREGWRATRALWKQAQAFAFGPAATLTPLIDWWPADADAIAEILASGGPYDAELVSTLGSDKRGLMTLEHLLFDPALTDGEVVAALEAGGADFAAALGVDLIAQLKAVREAWDPAVGGYADDFGAPGSESQFYKTPKDALDALVNEIVFLSDTAANLLAKPLGLKTGGTVDPTQEESRRSDNSLADVTDRVRSIEHVWEGRFVEGDGQGLTDMVASRSANLAEEVRAAVDAAHAALDEIPRPFATSLTESPALVEAGYDAVIALKRLLGSDVVTILGVTLTFNDNDGD